jgi:hypothetical protein
MSDDYQPPVSQRPVQAQSEYALAAELRDAIRRIADERIAAKRHVGDPGGSGLPGPTGPTGATGATGATGPAGNTLPVFGWQGAITDVARSSPWPCTQAATYTEFDIVQADGNDVLVFDILKNGSVVDDVTTTATRKQTLSISVTVVDGDDIQVELTDEGGGAAVNVGIVFRP